MHSHSFVFQVQLRGLTPSTIYRVSVRTKHPKAVLEQRPVERCVDFKTGHKSWFSFLVFEPFPLRILPPVRLLFAVATILILSLPSAAFVFPTCSFRISPHFGISAPSLTAHMPPEILNNFPTPGPFTFFIAPC